MFQWFFYSSVASKDFMTRTRMRFKVMLWWMLEGCFIAFYWILQETMDKNAFDC